MSAKRVVWMGVLTIAVMVATEQNASAQIFVAPPPVVSYYVPSAPVVAAPVMAAPAVSYYTVPSVPVAPVVAAPAPVSYYTPAAPIAAVPAIATVPATVSYYTPVQVPYTARISRGLFGRTIVRTPFSVTKY